MLALQFVDEVQKCAWPFNEFKAIDQYFLTIVCVLTKGVCGGYYEVLSLKLTLETCDPLCTNVVLPFVIPHKKVLTFKCVAEILKRLPSVKAAE